MVNPAGIIKQNTFKQWKYILCTTGVQRNIFAEQLGNFEERHAGTQPAENANVVDFVLMIIFLRSLIKKNIQNLLCF